MAATGAKRRGHGEDAIYFAAAKNRYVGAVSLGFGPDGQRIRRKVYGRTKQEVRDKLKALHAELDRGLRTSGRSPLRQAVDEAARWVARPVGADARRQRGGHGTTSGDHRLQAFKRTHGRGMSGPHLTR